MYGSVSAADTPRRSLRSAPAQNALSPAPVITIARTSSRTSSPAATSCIWRFRSRDSALRASGRFSVTHATLPWCSTISSSGCDIPGGYHFPPPRSAAARSAAELGAPARAGLLADVRLEVLRRQLVPDERPRGARRLGQLVEIDAGPDPHAVQHRDHVLGGQVARGARGVRAAAEPAGRRVD